jgi:hypothetical protein
MKSSHSPSPNNSYSHQSLTRPNSLSPPAQERWQSSHLAQEVPRFSQHPFSVQ